MDKEKISFEEVKAIALEELDNSKNLNEWLERIVQSIYQKGKESKERQAMAHEKKTCDMMFVKDDAEMPSDWAYHCSKCKKGIARKEYTLIKYCPCCGSKIEKWTSEKDIWWDEFLKIT